MRSRAWGLLLLLGMSSVPAGAVFAEPPTFTRAAPGIDYAFVDRHSDDIEPFQIHAFKIDLEVAELRLVSAGSSARRRTVEQIVAPHPAVVAVNASFFDTDGRAIGLGVDEGQLVTAGRRQSWGALVVEGKKARIVLGGDIQDYRAYRLIVQGIPRLVVGGQVQRLKPQISERTAVCADGSTVTIAVATKIEATDFARFLSDAPVRGGLGCSDALNLDGGPSTQLVVRLPAMTLSVRGWGVPNALVAIPGK
jgi:exopolysaccharide biosynthesis protein